MHKSIGLLIAAALATLVFMIAAFVWPAILVDQTGRALIGKPVVNSVATFLAPEDLKGASFILLSDMYDDECNARQSEFSHLIVKLRDEGTAARMLHIGSHAFPHKSYEEAVNAKRAPTHMIIADRSVAYADSSVHWLKKPCLLELDDGEVVKIRVGSDFEEWITKTD